ncbi:bifunctional glycosyltransferase family 2 protein/CDP-glycerol:glycerophosphate glycerophosphotransferase [Streptosporangiaceae bacterium NEAU-GS5]|nr:bifunctional glycosyltransferase family 2 protein/CDP-glycerol:glycerophosphate glycerophosphotransferase [Streptosporangiaceae bacterium NEAU-GS5]
MAKLSVVVPFFNVEAYIAECLDSLRTQTLTDIEIILVDDGSRDGSAAIAHAAAESDPRFRVITQDNQGLGPARNTGARHARGDYLAFADSDDVVLPEAYEKLVGTLDETGSDLACGGVLRVTDSGTRASRIHRPAFKETLQTTHIREHRELMRDRTAWNKVFRRSFWDQHGFVFPPGRYEDCPVTIPAHVLSRSTDVLGDAVYLWRQRPGSITAQRTDLGNLRDRFATMRVVADFLDQHARRLRRRHDRVIAETDIAFLLEAVASAHDLDPFVELGRSVLGWLDPAAVERLSGMDRLQLHLIRTGMTAELREVVDFVRTRLPDRAAVRRGLFKPRWYSDYPFRGDQRIPQELYDAEREMTLRGRVDDVRYTGGRIEISGHAYIRWLDSSRSDLALWLACGDRRVNLDITRVARPDVTADSRQSAVNHDNSGFVASFDPTCLDAAGTWRLHGEVVARGVVREGLFKASSKGGDRLLPPIPGPLCLHPELSCDDGLMVTAVEGCAGCPDLVGGVDRLEWAPDGTLRGLPGAMLVSGPESRPLNRDLRSGTWRVEVGGQPLRAAPALAADLPAPRTNGFQEMSFRIGPGNAVSLAVRPALGPDERGRYVNRRRGTARRRGPLREAALFDSYGGAQYSCNPRAISEELARRGGVDLIWVTRDAPLPAPSGVRQVLYGSRAHEEALTTSRYVIVNRRTQPAWYAKRRGQFFVQTWHGTPLKRLGSDIKDMPYGQRDLYEDLDRYSTMWDLFVSPNPFSTPIFRRAFEYGGEMLESGYPRNDLLFRPELAAGVRRRLGVSDEARLVLYAPTWRDDEHAGRGRLSLPFDLGRAAAALPEDHVLLVRAHYLVADRIAAHSGPRVLDVSRYPDMADLLLAADVLVTDYSSAMFDYASTGRPMVFLCPDLARYRDQVRGFYMDFEACAPGPIVSTTGELADALRGLDPGAYKQRYEAFQAAYCPWDDGRAASRVVDRLLKR